MENVNPKFEYIFDFLENDYWDNEKDNAFDNLLKEALKSRGQYYKAMKLDDKKVNEFFVVRECLRCIAIENFALMRIKTYPNSTRIRIELESETLDFDANDLKNMFINVLRISKFVCFETRLNGKLALIAEITVFKDHEK